MIQCLSDPIPQPSTGVQSATTKQEFRRLIGYTDVNNERSWQSPKSFPFTGRGATAAAAYTVCARQTDAIIKYLK
jgi:hypothetical protein